MSEKTKKEQLKELQMSQINGEAKTVKANGADRDIPANEADRVHIELIQRINNPVTKKYDENTRVLSLTVQEFEQYDKSGAFAAYDTQTILHDPRSKSEKKAAEDDSPELEELRARYETATGKKPGNKKAETLQAEIDAAAK